MAAVRVDQDRVTEVIQAARARAAPTAVASGWTATKASIPKQGNFRSFRKDAKSEDPRLGRC